MYYYVILAPDASLAFLYRAKNELAEQIDDDLSALFPLRLKDSSAVLPGDC